MPTALTSSWSTWTVNHMYATNYQNGRVFCMGDAVHRHPPSNGLGSNGEWCNPRGQALGAFPTTRTGNPLVDAFLWVKAPGDYFTTRIVPPATVERITLNPLGLYVTSINWTQLAKAERRSPDESFTSPPTGVVP